MSISKATSGVPNDGKKSIILCTTISSSLVAMHGFPEYLASCGWKVTVVSSPGKRLSELGRNESLTTIDLDMERDPSPLKDLVSLFKWIQLLKRLSPDLIFAGTPKSSFLSITASWLCRVPNRIYILRGLRLETSKGLSWITFWFIEKFTMTISHRVLAVSPSLAEVAQELHLLDRSKIQVLGKGSSNGVDNEKYRQLALSANALREKVNWKVWGQARISTPVIGFAGRVHVDKGFKVLVEALRIVTSRDTKFKFMVVGELDGVSAEALAFELSSICEDFFVTGWVDDPSEYYFAMDFLCLPSYREGFPNVVLEASAAGIPSIVSDATGAVDSVIDEETGLVTRAGDAQSLADAIERFITDTELRMQAGEAARKRVRENFDRQRVWDLTESFLSDAISKPRRNRLERQN